MKLYRLISAIVLFCVGHSIAQFLPQVPMIEKGSDGSPKQFDFSIPLTSIIPEADSFLQLKTQPLFLFYFSPKCPHCKETYPRYLAMLKKYQSYGLKGAAISVSGVTKNEIRDFISRQSMKIPTFQDEQRKFSDAYGTGQVPLLIIVKNNGQFIRYTKNERETMGQIQAELNKILVASKQL